MTVSESGLVSSPRTPTERVLAELWTEVLGIAPPGVEEDLFAAGGDSIMAVALLARACDRLGVELALGDFLAEPTIAALAGALDETQAARSPAPQPSEPAGGPSSLAQERFWFIDQASEGNVVSNVSWAVRLDGPLDPAVLQRSFSALARRHETLRTRFELRDGQPVSVVDPAADIELRVVPASDEARARALAEADAARPFDLTRAPLLRAQLLVLGPEAHVLHFVAHHIICDDWSKGVIHAELAALYAGLDLPPVAVQYPAYARWQRERLTEAVLERELAHWQERLSGAPGALELPTDRPRPPAPSLRGERLRTTIPRELALGARALGQAEGATLFMTMLAALQAFLYRYTGQDDLVVGTAIDNRGRVELEQAIGLYTNVLALRGEVSDASTFRSLIAGARAGTLDAAAHQELPFDRLAAVAPERDATRHPIFQVFYEFIVPAPLELALPGVRSQVFEVPKHTAEFDLGLYLDEQHGGLDAVWEYSTDLFEPDTIARMARHFVTLLAGLVAEPDRPLAGLALLGEDERTAAVAAATGGPALSPVTPVHESFAAHAGQAPDAAALVAGGQVLTYSELDRRANRIARLLIERGVRRGDAVGLSLERTSDLVAALLGVLKAGAAYVPLNPEHPAPRLVQQLQTARASVLVAAEALAGFEGQLLALEDEEARLAALPADDPAVPVEPESLAYVLYTSGSTGVPKGVAVTHANLANYTAHMVRTLGGADTTGLALGSVSSVSTDLGNTAIFPALAGGGCLHLIPTDVSTDGAAFAAYVSERPLDVLKITPSHLSTLLDASGGRSILPRRWLVVGGEAFTWELAGRVSVPDGPRVMNHYGPTEATVGCCTFEIVPGAARPPAATVPIGRPIDGDRAYVLDRLMAPAPVGVPGELYIGGAGVAQGYIGQPEQTAGSFVDDPFASGRLYRTGDLARRLADGNLEFLGRIDQQVKIRGYRVEPAEVQAVLLSEPGVRQAAVLAAGDGEAKRLIAYVVAGEGVSADGLRDALAATLPSYMVPAQIGLLDALPLTSNGKLDRAALPSLEDAPAGPAAPGEAEAMSEVEAGLAAIWGELLGHEPGLDDNFFETGGHSLLAIRLIAAVRSQLGAKLALKALIDSPTVRLLAARIESAAGTTAPAGTAPAAADAPAAAPVAPALPRAPRDGALRCSFAQEQFWLVDQLTPGSAAYNFSWPMRLRGRVDVDALHRAVAELVRRHEALRTRFTATDGQPMQIVEKAGAVELEVCEASGEAQAVRLIDEHTQTPFDLATGPLLRVVLIRLGEEEHILQIVVHHIVFDGVSKVVLYRELGALYDAYAAGRPSPLPEPEAQYGDYAEWQRTELTPERLADELAHWREQLAGMPTALELPTDLPRPAVASLRGARHRAPLPVELRQALEALARGEGATFFTAVLAAFDVLLHRYTGQDDVVVGTPVDTRSMPALESIVGPFINTVVLRNDLSGAPSFRELLRRTQERTLDAIEHQQLPFERLVAALAPERDLSRHPLFQALLALNPPETGLRLRGLEVEDLDPAWSGARVDLFLILDDLPHGLEAIWEYSTDLFEPGTVERMAGHFVRLLEGVVAEPDRSIAELDLLSGGERSRLLEEWNDTAREVPAARLEELISRQSLADPDGIAVQCDGRALTYGELEARANRLAHWLRAQGVGRADLVGVCLGRSEALPVALLGTLKAGAAYVPIDPAFPSARQHFMLADAQVRALITEEAQLDGLPAVQAPVLCLDRDRAALADEPETAPAIEAGPHDLAYVIYTSGSTGQPKGVEIAHRALVNFLTSMRAEPGLGRDDVLVAVTTLSFDIAGLELYLPLLCGARLVIAPVSATTDPRALARLLESAGATVMQATPSTWRMLVDAGWPGRAGFRALCGGEALPPALADELIGRGLELWNMYGPTETTIWSTCAHLSAAGEPPTVGRPIANTSLFILDELGRPTPVGVPGELFIGGAGLARGYRNRPELTAERFVESPFGRLYRTGDRARYRAEGTVEYLGRLDHQIKLRGYRIELGEIEATLARHPLVSGAAVSLFAAGAEPALVGYVVADGRAPDGQELARHLSETLPAYMVPSAFVVLDVLPLTPNGKLDRAALPAPAAPVSAAVEFVEPASGTEKALATLFCEVLGVERVSLADDFFALGGQSLLAARLISRLDARFGVELPLRTLFEARSVGALAAAVQALRPAPAPAVAVPEPALTLAPSPGPQAPPLLPEARTRPASFAQERFWFIDQVAAGSAAYNISWPLRLRGPLDAVALGRALTEIVRRHEVLRTRFAGEDGRPVQVIEPPRALPLDFLDLSAEPDGERGARERVDALTQAPFDLATGPLVRAALIRLSAEDHILAVVVHHVAADGWSKVVFFRELSGLYQAFRDNRPSVLAEPPLQYADFAAWQRAALTGERLERELEHWSAALRGIPAGLELPADRPRPEVASLRGAWLRTTVPPVTVERLGALAQTQGATLFMVLLAAFDVLLYRYTGQDDLVVGTPVDTRGRAELEQLIGPFVNTLALRSDLSGAPTFRELLERVKRTALEAIEHQDLPFERLVEALAPGRDLSRHPLFQALLALNPPEPPITLPGLEVEQVETRKVSSRVDLTLLLQQREDGLDAVWEYSSDLFEAATVQRMGRHFLRLLEAVLADPERSIDELALLDAAERAELLEAVNSPEQTFETFCLHERFEAQAAATPDALAIVHDEESLTYGELNRRANRLAHRLRALGVGPDALVALCLERSLDLVVAVLGTVKAGGAYVPLDPDYPQDRLAFVLEDCRAAVLVTSEGLLDRVPSGEATVVCMEDSALATAGDTNPASQTTPGNLAYVIYTSGSTGRPKGVLVEHGNVARLFTATDAWFGFGASDVWTLLHSYAFDFSVWEMWGALLHGGAVSIVPAWTARSPEALAAQLVRDRVTVLNATPSLFMTAMDELLAVAGELALRFVVFGGEALQTRLLRPWYERLGERGPQLVNMYGITETTVHVTYRPLTAADARRDGSPIGRPIPDLRLYLLDRAMNPVPAGVAGELYVGGAGVARGYLRRPELSAERFLVNPFGPGRLYRTGDRARWVPDQGLLFEGRLDDQVKVRGFRIELGEIQAALAEDEAVAECAVVADLPAPGDTRIAAYVVPAAAGAPVADLRATLRERLRARLPEYMVPASITFMDALPLTANGKLDRRALPAPADERPAADAQPPRTETERTLASLWQELLGIEVVGVKDDFFELGGHSLLAAQLAARVRAHFDTNVSVRAVFEAPTIAGLAARLDNNGAGAPRPVGSTAEVRRSPGEPWPLSYSQQQLWLIDQWDPGAPTYNVALPFRVRGALDREALESALRTLARRHEALRTIVRVRDDRPVPELLDDPEIPLAVIDTGSESEALRVATDLSRRPFDFARDPLLRATLIRLAPEDHVLLLETHHIAFDARSEQLLLEELAALYAGEDLEEPALQFGDYARWERAWLSSEAVQDDLGFWRRHLAGAPTSVPLPVDHPRPDGRRFAGASHDLALPADVAAAVRTLCREENATPYMLTLAVLATLLFRVTGQDDLLIGSPVANRARPELEPVIGFFSNTLVFRARMGGNPTFRELLDRVRDMALDVYSHPGVPFEKIVEAVAPEREPGVNPLFQVNLRVSTGRRPSLELRGLEIEALKVDSGLSRFDLALDLDVLENAVSGYFRYNRDIFEPATVARLADEFAATLRQALDSPDLGLLSFALAGDWSGGAEAPSGLRGFRARARRDAVPPAS